MGLLLLLLSLENLLPLSLLQNLLELGFVLRSQTPVQNQSVRQHVTNIKLNEQPPTTHANDTTGPHSEGGWYSHSCVTDDDHDLILVRHADLY